MSLWKIAWRSIQQRSLASTLTAISMALGVALVVTVLVIHGVLEEAFTRGAQGYHLVVGKKGSQLQLVLNTVYHLQESMEPLPYSFYKDFIATGSHRGKYSGYVQLAIPYCLGDNYEGFRVVGTVPELFDKLEYSGGQHYQFQPGGRNIDPDQFFEAVVGAEAARKTGLKVGEQFQPTHGLGNEGDGHKHDAFTVVGILEPTGTANDRALFINIEGFYLLDNHAKPVEDAPAPKAAKLLRVHADDDKGHEHAVPYEHKSVSQDQADDHKTAPHDHADDHKGEPHDHADDVKDHAKDHADDKANPLRHADGKGSAHDHVGDVKSATDRHEADAKTTDPEKVEAHKHDPDDHDAHEHDAAKADADHDHKDHDHKADAHAEDHPADKHAEDHDHAADAHAVDHDHKAITDKADTHKSDAHEDHDHAGHDYADHDHAGHDHSGHDHAHHEPLPENQREVTAILVLAKNDIFAQQLQRKINEGVEGQAASPIKVVQEFFAKMVSSISYVLLALTILIMIEAGVGIMVSIYNSMSDRRREIAVMRALGAGRRTVLTVVLLESILLSVGGGLLGFLLGHGLVAAISPWVVERTGVSLGFLQFAWLHLTMGSNAISIPYEVLLIPGLVALASLVGFLPAMSAYRTDVAKALTASP